MMASFLEDVSSETLIFVGFPELVSPCNLAFVPQVSPARARKALAQYGFSRFREVPEGKPARLQGAERGLRAVATQAAAFGPGTGVRPPSGVVLAMCGVVGPPLRPRTSQATRKDLSRLGYPPSPNPL